jgi:hypothetical protein
MPCVREVDVIKYIPIKVSRHITYELCSEVITAICRTLHEFLQLLKEAFNDLPRQIIVFHFLALGNQILYIDPQKEMYGAYKSRRLNNNNNNNNNLLLYLQYAL